ncbi:MAG: DUF4920 domain-containing protein [Planctomycetota bacterium]
MLIPALLCATFLMTAPTTQPTTQPAMVSYGEPVPMDDATPLPLGVVLADAETYVGEQLWLEGEVADVCAKAGCWIKITDASAEGGSDAFLFIKFTCPIEGRLIPMDAIGKRAVVAGELAIREISEELARHYAEDAGASPEEIEAIRGPQTQVTMKAPFAQISVD